MSREFYSEIHLHVVFHAKGSDPLLTSEVEPLAWAAIRRKLVETDGVFVHEIGGTATHVHVCMTVSPSVRPSDLIGWIKGFSAFEVNRRIGRGGKLLEWQSGYGVVGFGTKDLEWVKAYVRNQKEHHANESAHERLERIREAEPDESP